MKKFLALVLAFLTVVGLSSAALAATVYTADDLSGYLNPFAGYSINADDVRRAIGSYDQGVMYDYNGLYTSWIAYCPKDGCRGVAFYFIADGKVNYYCPTCGSSGVIAGGSSSGGTIHTVTVLSPTRKDPLPRSSVCVSLPAGGSG